MTNEKHLQIIRTLLLVKDMIFELADTVGEDPRYSSMFDEDGLVYEALLNIEDTLE